MLVCPSGDVGGVYPVDLSEIECRSRLMLVAVRPHFLLPFPPSRHRTICDPSRIFLWQSPALSSAARGCYFCLFFRFLLFSSFLCDFFFFLTISGRCLWQFSLRFSSVHYLLLTDYLLSTKIPKTHHAQIVSHLCLKVCASVGLRVAAVVLRLLSSAS